MLFRSQSFLAIVGLSLASATACSTDREKPQDPAQRFVCADGKALDVIRTKDLAIVKIGERIFNLNAKRSSLGERYTDGESTLILDENTAVFVTSDGRDALNCDVSAEM